MKITSAIVFLNLCLVAKAQLIRSNDDLKYEGDILIEICTDSTLLNCWSFTDHDYKTGGFFLFNPTDSAPNYEKGFFVFYDAYALPKNLDSILYLDYSINKNSSPKDWLEAMYQIDSIINSGVINPQTKHVYKNSYNNQKIFGDKNSKRVFSTKFNISPMRLVNPNYSLNLFFSIAHCNFIARPSGKFASRIIVKSNRGRIRRLRKNHLKEISIPIYYVTTLYSLDFPLK